MNATCLIVDDEPLAIQLLQKHVYESGLLELKGSCSNAMEASAFLRTNKVDLLFLDIQMAKLTGIELLRMLKPAPYVIFTTAYRDYALDGYELDVVDYLLKPISFERFMASVEKFYRRWNSSDITEVSHNHSAPQQLLLQSGIKTYQVNEADIVLIESLKDYIRIHFTDGKKLMIKYKIGQLELELSANFLRVHKSFIVHKNRITVFGNQSVELGEISVPVGNHYKSFVEQLLKK
ncbi:MAG: LytR/AlgR family response regulator transcription factor [Sediminibacterium sp.]|jgi:two-component system, LytTR family, response regulator